MNKIQFSSNSPLFISYLHTLKNRLFRILPEYEEKNKTLPVYIESLLFEINGLHKIVQDETFNHVFVTIIGILNSLYNEVTLEDRHATIKREVFKCISLVDKVLDEKG